MGCASKGGYQLIIHVTFSSSLSLAITTMPSPRSLGTASPFLEPSRVDKRFLFLLAVLYSFWRQLAGILLLNFFGWKPRFLQLPVILSSRMHIAEVKSLARIASGTDCQGCKHLGLSDRHCRWTDTIDRFCANDERSFFLLSHATFLPSVFFLPRPLPSSLRSVAMVFGSWTKGIANGNHTRTASGSLLFFSRSKIIISLFVCFQTRVSTLSHARFFLIRLFTSV